MGFRSFGTFKVASSTVAMPLLGSWITAGIAGPSKVPLTLTLGSALNAGNDASQIFSPGDWAYLLNVDGSNGEPVLISAVSGNTVTLGNQTTHAEPGGANPVTTLTHASGAFGTGTFIMLKLDVNNLVVQYEDGGTGPWLYIGNQWNMTAAFKRIVKLAKVTSGIQPYSWSATENSAGNPFNTVEMWVLGSTAGDLYVPSFCIA